MSNIHWTDNGNERLHNTNNSHEKITLILNKCRVPAALEARTLQAMTDLRRRQERSSPPQT